MMKYSVRSLPELADAFELLAMDEDRKQQASRLKVDRERCIQRAMVWREAAAIVRQTKLDI